LLIIYFFSKSRKLNQIISSQKNEVVNKNILLSEAIKDIDDSLKYSLRIQSALLPSEGLMKQTFKNHFVYYKPKDVVSGDFYWTHQKDNSIYFCVADCTGHGVPGALVSVVGINGIQTAVVENNMESPALILDKLSAYVEKTFHTDEGNIKDGMDISFCKLNTDTNGLTYAGANNPIYILGQNGLQILRPNKQPIGQFEKRTPFEETTIKLSKGDRVYLFTDGYADQFGGAFGKKMMYKRLREILEPNTSLEMKQQEKMIIDNFESWKSSYDQVDDVCLLGIQI
jgi:serine phosphatase RsbU (regulator of sigma subunit)